MRTGWLGRAFAALVLLTQPAAADEALGRIKNIVVIYAENRSFDHLYGAFPGANGLGNATAEENTQLDHDGTKLPYGHLRQRREARPALPGDAERPVPHRRAASQYLTEPDRPEPDPRLLSQPGADQRRQEQHVRRHVHSRRLRHGPFRR